MQRKHYSVEFKQEAARLLILEGRSAPEVSQQLGVTPSLLYKWKREHLKQLERVHPAANGSSPTQMAAEIDQLRKQLAKERRINEILKKTVGYFAKDE